MVLCLPLFQPRLHEALHDGNSAAEDRERSKAGFKLFCSATNVQWRCWQSMQPAGVALDNVTAQLHAKHCVMLAVQYMQPTSILGTLAELPRAGPQMLLPAPKRHPAWLTMLAGIIIKHSSFSQMLAARLHLLAAWDKPSSCSAVHKPLTEAA